MPPERTDRDRPLHGGDRGARTRSIDASTLPVAAATSASPSTVRVRRAPGPGPARRGRPAATSRQPSLSSLAFVAIDADRRVLEPAAPQRSTRRRRRAPARRRCRRRCRRTALTATSAPTTSSPSRDRRAAESAGPRRARGLATCRRRSGAGPDRAELRHRPVRRGHCTRRSPRPRPGAPTRRRPARSNSASARRRSAPARPPVGKPMPSLLAAPHHPVGRGQPEGRAAGEHAPRRCGRRCGRARAGRTRASPARRRAPRPTRPCPRGTARPCSRSGPRVRPVPDAHAGDVGDHASARDTPRGTRALMPHTIS